MRPVEGVLADDGVSLHVEMSGGRGPLVVFSHGFTVDSAEWRRQTGALDGRARVVTWDHRGHGRSGWGDATHATVEQLGHDLAAVVDAVAPDEPVILVGHSMGGMAILALAHRRPEWFGLRVAGVLLVATSAGELLHEGLVGLLHRGARRVGVLPTVLAGLRTAAPAADRLPWRGSRLGNRFFRWLMFTPDDPADEVRAAQAATEATPLAVDAAFTSTLLGFDESAGFAALRTIPTTVVVAQDDRLTPASHGQRIGDALGPDGRLVSVPHAGHAVPQSHPQVVDDVLLHLVDRVTGE